MNENSVDLQQDFSEIETYVTLLKSEKLGGDTSPFKAPLDEMSIPKYLKNNGLCQIFVVK